MDFHLALQRKPFDSQDINGETIQITDERGRLVFLQGALRMTARGVGIFVVHNLDNRGPVSGVYHKLHRFGLAVDAFFALAAVDNTLEYV